MINPSQDLVQRAFDYASMFTKGTLQSGSGKAAEDLAKNVANEAAQKSAEAAVEKTGALFFKGIVDSFKGLDIAKVTHDSCENAAIIIKHIPETIIMQMGRGFSGLATTFLKEVDIVEASKHFLGQMTKVTKHALPLGAVLLTAGVVSFGAFCATHYLYKKAVHNIGKPALGTWENAQPSRSQVFWETYVTPLYRSYVDEPTKARSPVFSKEVQRRMMHITSVFSGRVKDKRPLSHLLVYGPGGTGKTMICHKIAQDAKVPYIKLSGGDFAQFCGRNEHVTQLKKLFNDIKRFPGPVIIVIDEFESLGLRRHPNMEHKLLELLNAFLAETGVETAKFMIIAATNRVEDLDQAILDRFDDKILIALPHLEERERIIREALPDLFTKDEVRAHFSNGEKVRQIAGKTEQFSGRQIVKLLESIGSLRYTGRLTNDEIDWVVETRIQQERAVRT